MTTIPSPGPFEEASRFSYKPLASTEDYIRTLRVLPDLKDGHIQCKLEHTSMTEPSFYACLSYVWGHPGVSHTILLNDTMFAVRRNLFEFLETARQRFNRPLWIDAISINQVDIHEKNEQVMQMGEIYRNASVVIAWLGDFPQLDPIIYFDRDLLEEWVRREEEDSEREENGHEDETPQRPPITAGRPNEVIAMLQAMGHLSSHVYLTRAWIIQETALAYVLWIWTSSGQIWREEYGAVGTILSDDEDYVNELLASDSLGVQEALELLDRDAPATLKLLGHSTHLEHDRVQILDLLFDENVHCDDPHDRVYSLRALLQDRNTLAVDYGEDSVSFFYRVCNHFDFWWTDRDLHLRDLLGIEAQMLEANDAHVALIPLVMVTPFIDRTWRRSNGAIMRCLECPRISGGSAKIALSLYQSNTNELLATGAKSESGEYDFIGCLEGGQMGARWSGHICFSKGTDGNYAAANGWWSTDARTSTPPHNLILLGQLGKTTLLEQCESDWSPVPYPESYPTRDNETLGKRRFRLAISKDDIIKRLSCPRTSLNPDHDVEWHIKQEEGSHGELKELRSLDPDDDGSWDLNYMKPSTENLEHALWPAL